MAAPFSWRCFQPGLSFHFPWAVSLQANHAFPALPSFLTCQICIHTRQFITGEACEHSRRLLNRNFYLVSLRDITLIPDKWFHIFQEEGSHKKSVSKPDLNIQTWSFFTCLYTTWILPSNPWVRSLLGAFLAVLTDIHWKAYYLLELQPPGFHRAI